jgi:hypothetical protein
MLDGDQRNTKSAAAMPSVPGVIARQR